MALMQFRPSRPAPASADPVLAAFLADASIEVMPRTLAMLGGTLADHLPAGREVFVAHLDGTDPADMQATVARLAQGGYRPVPHIPARLVPDRAALDRWTRGYLDAGASGALLLGGGVARPRGDFADSMALLETGLLSGFAHLFIAGHPEGNRDIDPAGGEAQVMAALRWKADFAARSDARVQIVTQFCFQAAPVIAWADRLRAAGIDLPIRVGLPGPARLQTMLKFAIMCGIGPSLSVLQHRARDVTRLMLPFDPRDIAADLARHRAAHPDGTVTAAHLFPLGGITTTTDWLAAASPDERLHPT